MLSSLYRFQHSRWPVGDHSRIPLHGTEVLISLARCIAHHRGESIDILDEERSAASLNNPNPGQAGELSGNGFAMRADPACDLDMGWRRNDAGSVPILGCQARQAKQLGLNAVVDGKSAELIDTGRKRADGCA